MSELILAVLLGVNVWIIVILFVIKKTWKLIKQIPKKITCDYIYLTKIAKKGGILFLGDSIIEFFNVNGFFSGKLVHNRGVAGNTTTDLLERLPSNVYPLEPDEVFLLIGTNDLGKGKSVDDTLKGINSVIKALQEHLPKSRIFLLSLLPVNSKLSKIAKRMVGKRFNYDIDLVNKSLDKEAKDYTFIDINSALKDEYGDLNKIFTFDGLHPNFEGYIKISEMLDNYISNQ